MSAEEISIEKVRASRDGHMFHERWTARRALQLVFPQDNLYAIAIEGLSSKDTADPGDAAEEVADLILYYGNGDTFETCDTLNTVQFKYKSDGQAVTSSYLKKTIQKFAETINGYEKDASSENVDKKLSFSFITNCDFVEHLWEAIRHLQGGSKPSSSKGRRQLVNLRKWCEEKGADPVRLFERTTFQAATADLSTHNSKLRRTLSDWSAGADVQSRARLFELAELVRDKAGSKGQRNNLIKREDVLDALGCDVEDLFPADTRFIDVGEIVLRSVNVQVSDLLRKSNVPVFLCADGGVGKTVFVQTLASEWADKFEVIVFDCFGGGAYRSEDQGRHLPKVGLLQIVNELAARGLCDPMLPSDNDTLGIIKATRKRLDQASKTIAAQSKKLGVLVVIDAADNAHIEASNRNEDAFPKLLLSSLGRRPIPGVKLLLTARTHRMSDVVGGEDVVSCELPPFNASEIEKFVGNRRQDVSSVEMARAIARSGGNARVLDYLVKSWNDEIRDRTEDTKITVEELIANRCDAIIADLYLKGWNRPGIVRFFAAISLLPPPIPPDELANALDWSASEMRSAISDLAPMLETISHGAIFRDEPTETYIRETYSKDTTSQQEIADRLIQRQKDSMYAAQALPRFLEVIDDVNRAYELAESEVFPAEIQTKYGERRLKLARLQAAFSLAVKRDDFNLLLKLAMQMAQVASANSKGDEYVRRAPGLAAILGDGDAFRRLLDDRTGWHGARHCRMTLAYCFLGELEEAEIHCGRAVEWINWHARQRDEEDRVNRHGPDASDFASVVFFSILNGSIDVADQNLSKWNERFSQRVAHLIVTLGDQYEALTDRPLLHEIERFAASKDCKSLSLQVALLVALKKPNETKHLQRIARAASTLLGRTGVKNTSPDYDTQKSLESDFAKASFAALIHNSKQSAQRILVACKQERPSRYDYSERYGPSRGFAPVLSSCLGAWIHGKQPTFHHLLPKEVTVRGNQKRISRSEDAMALLECQMVTYPNGRKDKKGKPLPQRQFDDADCGKICSGIEKTLAILRPLEAAIFRDDSLKAVDFHQFLSNWKTHIRTVSWSFEQATDGLTRTIGLGFASLILQHADQIDEHDAQTLIDIVSGARFSIEDQIRVLKLLSQRDNLRELAGKFGLKISAWISKDEYVEQRGENYQELTRALLPLGFAEAREYYKEGLAQLDQMGSDDHDLVYSVLRYADTQRGGLLEPRLSQRLMNLCQIVAHHEPRKFGWTLYSSAAASSIGFPAVYKFLRWADQDVSDYSYGLPELVCFLAKRKLLCPKRAAAVLTLCELFGSHDWGIGRGLSDILSAAQVDDQKDIVKVVLAKVLVEHRDDGWDALWRGMLETFEEYEGVVDASDLDQLRQLKKDSRELRDERDKRLNGTSPSFLVDATAQDLQENSLEAAFQRVVVECDPSSALSIDESIQTVQENKEFGYDAKVRLLEALAKSCPVEKRVSFVNALCEAQNVYFDDAVDHILELTREWQNSSAYVSKNRGAIVEHLFAFKGSRLFEGRYARISQQIKKLSDYCGSNEHVMRIVVKVVAGEHLILDGDEWLELASSIAGVADDSTGLTALEQLLTGPMAKVGDEIGEGPYHDALSPPTDETELVADVFWHLLGNEDAFVRWNSARSVLSLVELGLNAELNAVFDRIGTPSGGRLRSEHHQHAFYNAEQWFLIGLARATHFEPSKLSMFGPRLEALFYCPNAHVLSKVLIARCLTNLWKETVEEDKLLDIWAAINIPAAGYVTSENWPDHTEPKSEFRFDYDFKKNQIADLARLFGISLGEASDAVSDAVRKQWPDAEDMGYFHVEERYHRSQPNRHESFREQVQRHALLKAATAMAAHRPVVRRSHESELELPWPEWITGFDLTFEDGTWLADNKDAVPECAHQFLLEPRQSGPETICNLDELLEKIGLQAPDELGMFPIFGTWRSRDGVSVRIVSALVRDWGSVRICRSTAKLPDHELWLPMLDSDGEAHRYSDPSEFIPWIWDPERYRSGIDEEDKFAALSAATRAKVGPKILDAYQLSSNDEGKDWADQDGNLVLQSTVWGSWTSGSDGYVQNDGSVLRASKNWLDAMAADTKQSLAYHIHIEKYKSYRSYDRDTGVKHVYVGLLRRGANLRIWPARLASKTHY